LGAPAKWKQSRPLYAGVVFSASYGMMDLRTSTHHKGAAVKSRTLVLALVGELTFGIVAALGLGLSGPPPVVLGTAIPSIQQRELRDWGPTSTNNDFVNLIVSAMGESTVPSYTDAQIAPILQWEQEFCDDLRTDNKDDFVMKAATYLIDEDFLHTVAAGSILAGCNDYQFKAMTWGLPASTFDKFPLK